MFFKISKPYDCNKNYGQEPRRLIGKKNQALPYITCHRKATFGCLKSKNLQKKIQHKIIKCITNKLSLFFKQFILYYYYKGMRVVMTEGKRTYKNDNAANHAQASFLSSPEHESSARFKYCLENRDSGLIVSA